MINIIAGAMGKTGRLLERGLLDQGHTVIALVRESCDTSVLPKGADLRRGALTDLQRGVCDGADVVIYAAGSGGSTGPEVTDKVDRDGAIGLIDRSKNAGIDRFVMLSSVGADQSDPSGNLAHYFKAKHDADQHLQASDLTYAILRPVSLTDDGRSAEI